MIVDIEACYEKYAPMVFRRCMGILGNEDDALDAAQDVFVKLLHHRGRLHGQFLSSLLYTMATNTCLNLLRQRKQRRTDSLDTQAVLQSSPITASLAAPLLATHDPEFERIEAGMLMDVIFQSESESTRTICFMYHADGMTLNEIGKAMGLSISGVRKRLSAFNTRAKQKWEGGSNNE